MQSDGQWIEFLKYNKFFVKWWKSTGWYRKICNLFLLRFSEYYKIPIYFEIPQSNPFWLHIFANSEYLINNLLFWKINAIINIRKTYRVIYIFIKVLSYGKIWKKVRTSQKITSVPNFQESLQKYSSLPRKNAPFTAGSV